jgi:hypothetical protein
MEPITLPTLPLGLGHKMAFSFVCALMCGWYNKGEITKEQFDFAIKTIMENEGKRIAPYPSCFEYR